MKNNIIMTSCCLIILTLIFPLFYIIAQASTFGQQLSLMELVASKNNETEHQKHANTYLHPTAENEVTTNLRSGKGQSFSHGRHHARTVSVLITIISYSSCCWLLITTTQILTQTGSWDPEHYWLGNSLANRSDHRKIPEKISNWIWWMAPNSHAVPNFRIHSWNRWLGHWLMAWQLFQTLHS